MKQFTNYGKRKLVVIYNNKKDETRGRTTQVLHDKKVLNKMTKK